MTLRRNAPITVLIADDHRLMREGMAALLARDPRVAVVGTVANGREAVDAALEIRPAVVLLDLNMPVLGGMEACAILASRLPGTQVLMLTASERQDDLYAAMRFGAAGYLLKDMPPRDLIESVVAVARGERRIPASIAARVLSDLEARGPAPVREARRDDRTSALSPREAEVLALLACGLPNREIAERLVVSEATVKTHVRHILEKLHVRNRAEAAAHAARVEA